MARGRSGRSRGGKRGKGSFHVSIDIDPPIKSLIERFEFLKDELRDMRPAWDVMIPQLRREMGRHFMTGGAATGKKWPELKSSYAKRKANGALMVASGKLLTRATTKGVMGRSKTRLKFGVRAPGARALHFGSKTQGIPARPFVVATPKIQKIASKAVNDRVSEILAKFEIKRGRSKAERVAMRKAA